MNKILTFIVSLVLTIFTLTSCVDEVDLSNPSIVISSPVNGDVFSITDKIEVVGRATDDASLRNFLMTSDLGLERSINEFDDPTDFPFIIELDLDTTTTIGDYDIVFKVEDTSGNEAETTVNITIQ